LSSLLAEERARASLARVLEAAFTRLEGNGSLEAVLWAVAALEDDPQFNAGTGAKLQADGVARLSASLMDGAARRFSGVVNVERVKNPVLLARRLQTEADRVLAGEGARKFARKNRIPEFNPITEERWSEWRRKSGSPPSKSERMFGTVGAVAVDTEGKLSAATSTGGKGMAVPGRVGDTATVAGNFASAKAAVSATGVGEEIVDLGLAVRIVTRVDDGASLGAAFQKTFREARRLCFRAGAIGVDWRGKVAVAATTPCILHAIRTPARSTTCP
jgi:L-asparaginase